MAVITEYYTTRSDGVILNRTYSDSGMMLERDGVLYEEAIDPADSGRVYTESTQPCSEADTEDYLAALERFGVE